MILLLGMPLLAQSQSTFEEDGILYMEDLSDSSKLAVYVMPKHTPMSGHRSGYIGIVSIPAKITHDLDEYEVIGITSLALSSDYVEEILIEEGPYYDS